ncbi:MAG: hypothetical protein WCS01_01650 [bacterium]|jgi:hypothetical protein
MNIRQTIGRCVLLTLALNCVSCASMLHSVRLPLTIRVVEEGTGQVVPGATVQLQWRSGFQGYYWGKPVAKQTDVSGNVLFALGDVPPISSDGYSLGKEIRKVFIATVVVSAPGCEKTAVKYPDASQSFDITIRRSPVVFLPSD